MPSKGICVFVTEDSESLNYVKVGDSVNLKYFTTAAVTGGGKGKRHTETSASGFYELADLRDGVWEVKVEVTGYKKTQTTIEIRGERRHEHSLELTPKKK
ncbi:MAG: hypothetical protein JSV40_02805 [Deltaproteobacteria bacterium]|nr:MAG: hypothetical protein JSV40_02805 [Deltaproteobacteria bacterium]